MLKHRSHQTSLNLITILNLKELAIFDRVPAVCSLTMTAAEHHGRPDLSLLIMCLDWSRLGRRMLLEI